MVSQFVPSPKKKPHGELQHAVVAHVVVQHGEQFPFFRIKIGLIFFILLIILFCRYSLYHGQAKNGNIVGTGTKKQR